MLRNYITTILRGIRKNRFFTLINLFGLSIAMACFIIVGLYVNYELSYDKFHEEVEDIYLVQMEFNKEMGGFMGSMLPPVMGQELEDKIPAIEHATVTSTGTGNMSVEAGTGEYLEEKYYMVQNSFFDVFTFPLLYGDAKTALTEPTAIVISEEMARKYFNRTNAVGQTLKVDGKGEFKVSAVLKSFPKNSQFQPHFLLSYNDLNDITTLTSWGMNIAFVYIKTLPGADLEKLKSDIWTLYESKEIENSMYADAGLNSFQETYWKSSGGAWLNNRDRGLGADKNIIYTFSGLAILLLFIAMANYVNMATAKAVERAKEVGVRKVNGATRSQLWGQFLMETIFFALLCLVFALILVEIVLPSVSRVIGISLSVDYTNLNRLLVLVGYALLCGIIAGFYPAAFLSRFNPIKAIKGDITTSRRRFSSKGVLLFFQFTISSILIVMLLVANTQIRHYINFDLGFDKEQVISIHAPDGLRKDGVSVLNRIKNINGVATATKGAMPFGGDGAAKITYKDQKLGYITKAHVDEQFLPMFDIKLLSGRNFDINRPEDFGNSIIVNRAFMDKVGSGDLINELVDVSGRTMRIIGVMENFYMEGAISVERPMYLFASKTNFARVLIKLEKGNPTETLAGLEDIWRPYLGKKAFKYEFLDKAYEARLSKLKRITWVVNSVTTIIVILSLFGLFSLVVFNTSRKLKDVGIRKVLGASSVHILSILGKPYIGVLALSSAMALPVAYYLAGEALQQYPNRVELGAGFGIAAVLVITILSVVVILSRAVTTSRLNPVDVLRNE